MVNVTKHARNILFQHFILLMILMAGIQAQAQDRAITGTVTEGNGSALPGVTVIVKNSNIGTATDNDGKFSLNVPSSATTLTFSSTGFETIDVEVPSSGILDVVLTVADNQLSEVVISVGSRNSQRTITDSPLPVDILNVTDLQSTGQLTFDKALQYRVPSFNTVNTPVNDATTLLDPYEIRNLGPSRTLILINGKRKNLSSLLYVQFAPGRGETGVDLSAIPTEAIKRVEILRDGASAQYGSDAIAGVMNVILKDRYDYSSLNLYSGVTGEGDGATYGASFNSGGNFGTKGFINYTLAFTQQNNAVRSGKVDLATEIATFGGNAAADAQITSYLQRFPDANNTNGTGEITAAKFVVNAGLPVGELGQVYANAAFISKK